MSFTTIEAASFGMLLKKVRDDRRFWPDEATFRLAHQVLPVPATEVAVVNNGRLLLQYRLFDDWPEPHNKPGWYIPGGYVPWGASFEEACATHLKKDQRGEYKRAGVDGGNLDAVKLGPLTCIGVKKWMPGEHPFGAPVSLVMVTELEEGTILETDWLKWSDEVIKTDVPHHEKFQKMVFHWLKSPPEYRAWLREMHAIAD